MAYMTGLELDHREFARRINQAITTCARSTTAYLIMAREAYMLTTDARFFKWLATAPRRQAARRQRL